jgi:hypothetical protein
MPRLVMGVMLVKSCTKNMRILCLTSLVLSLCNARFGGSLWTHTPGEIVN